MPEPVGAWRAAEPLAGSPPPVGNFSPAVLENIERAVDLASAIALLHRHEPTWEAA